MLTTALLAVLAVPALAAPSIEAVKASAGAGLAAPIAFKPFKLANRHVSLSGDVELSGTGFVHGGGTRHVSVPLHGRVRVSGDGGKVQGDGSVSAHASVWVREGSSHVSDFVQVTATVSLYKQGRYVGTATVSGSVHVSGWATGSTLRLSGRGTASGSAFIREDDPQAP